MGETLACSDVKGDEPLRGGPLCVNRLLFLCYKPCVSNYCAGRNINYRYTDSRSVCHIAFFVTLRRDGQRCGRGGAVRPTN